MKLKDLDWIMPRERLMLKGSEALSDYELLAIILQTGIRGENVVDLAKRILDENSLTKLRNMTISELMRIRGLGSAKACLIRSMFDLTLRSDAPQKKKIKSSKDVFFYYRNMGSLKQEHFKALYLNSRCIIIASEVIGIGTLDSVLVHPREVFSGAIKNHAHSVIIVHNHPSGQVSPSDDDFAITKKMYDSGNVLGIEIFDHIIIAGNKFFSFKDEGYL